MTDATESQKEAAILEVLSANPMSRPQLVEVTGLPDASVRDTLHSLQRLGVIETWTLDAHATVYRKVPA